MGGLDEATIRRMFCNDIDEAQTQLVLDHTGHGGRRRRSPSRSPGPGSRRTLPKTYVRLLRDQALDRPTTRTRRSRTSRASPGGDGAASSSSTPGHDVMISAPERLAAALTSLAST